MVEAFRRPLVGHALGGPDRDHAVRRPGRRGGADPVLAVDHVAAEPAATTTTFTLGVIVRRPAVRIATSPRSARGIRGIRGTRCIRGHRPEQPPATPDPSR